MKDELKSPIMICPICHKRYPTHTYVHLAMWDYRDTFFGKDDACPIGGWSICPECAKSVRDHIESIRSTRYNKEVDRIFETIVDAIYAPAQKDDE